LSDEKDLRDTRREYQSAGLRRSWLNPDPIQQFSLWLEDARAAQVKDATAMALATAVDGMPSQRIVLLKHFDAAGFCWYTDKASQKGRELAANPQASLLFYWREFERQVRISGDVELLDDSLNDQYFHSRPADSRFSAAASQQSRPVDSRDTLKARIDALRAQHPEDDVPRPAQWGGYRLRPREIEFWQGRESRLHDRFRFCRDAAEWRIERLQP
jgi:pyridoxamine 5'-phosphate oxidase